jgi:hypothetical protein
MREMGFTTAFRRDYKRLARSGQADLTLLEKHDSRIEIRGYFAGCHKMNIFKTIEN